MRSFRFDPGALAEYEAAVRWYQESSTVAPAFVAAVEDAIQRIRQAPGRFARWRGFEEHEVRRCVVRRFPFVVVFRVTESELVVVAVAHSRRRPSYWTKRGSR